MSQDILGGPRTQEAAARLQLSESRLKRTKWTTVFGIGAAATYIATETQIVSNGWAKVGVTVAGLGAALVGARQVATETQSFEGLENRLVGLTPPQVEAVTEADITLMHEVLARDRQQTQVE